MERAWIDSDGLKRSRTEAALLELLRAGLWERPARDGVCRLLSASEWEEVFRQACRQTVCGLTYRGLHFLDAETVPPLLVAARWAAAADAIERRNRKMNGVIGKLWARFESQGLEVWLQKGQGLAGCYLRPELRECGDIDFYFPGGNRKRADQLVDGWQADRQERPDHSSCYRWDGFVVEHHSRLFDLWNPGIQTWLKQLEKEWGGQELEWPDGGKCRIPAPELTLLLLNAHILKHAMGHGVGLRQFCDLARAVSVYEKVGRLSRKEIGELFRKAGLEKWSRLLFAFVEQELKPDGWNWYETGRKPDTGALRRRVWAGGNFGQHAAGGTCRNGWRRKLDTGMAWLRNGSFSLRYAPGEALAQSLSLLGGQF